MDQARSTVVTARDLTLAMPDVYDIPRSPSEFLNKGVLTHPEARFVDLVGQQNQYAGGSGLLCFLQGRLQPCMQIFCGSQVDCAGRNPEAVKALLTRMFRRCVTRNQNDIVKKISYLHALGR